MAEKEERYISITQMVAKENIETEKYRVMPRQEAIEKMAKAICKFEMTCIRHICEECTEDCTDHLEMEVVDKAESALNALLEK